VSSDETERIMVDIETLGTDPGSAILSIGAVKFTENYRGREFYEEISLQSCQDAGLEIDADTLQWWLDQDQAVSGILTGGRDLGTVLSAFKVWYPEDAEIWANSPSFDCELLKRAFDAVGMTEPWEYYDERDFRTLRSLPCAAEVEMDGDEHDALDDARHQARIVSETLHALGNDGDSQ